MKTVKQIKRKIKKNDSKGPIKILSLKRKHFKKTLSTSVGFGFQDMKQAPKKLITKLMCENMDLQFIPNGNRSAMNVDIFVNRTPKN